MARALSFLRDDGWPSDEGWPYADGDAEPDEIELADPGADVDDDLVALHASGPHLFDGLEQLERIVLNARFGFDGRQRSMRELQHETGMSREQLRHALGDGLAKVRTRLTSDVI